jgi:2-(1,2-epoxy-1,2-dihydrophenyl)acetyl-CoA isomerase
MGESRIIETGTEDLLARVEDRVAILTMNRPERRNAFSDPMIDGMALALREAERASDIGCVVLTGAGGAFCAGGDVKSMAGEGGGASASGITGPHDAAHRQVLSQRNTAGAIHELPKPVIASLPGAAAGAGFALALACDLRIAADNAIMTTAFGRVGFSGDYGGTWFLTQLVGPAKARELYFLPERIDAKQAESLGLVNWVVPQDALEERTRELALRLADGPTVAYRYMKENLNRAITGGLRECMDLEVYHHHATGRTEDHREAARAFVEKREPVFKGR